MRKIIISLIIAVLVVVFVGFNEKLFPARKEITKLAMTRVIGVDEETDGKKRTFNYSK